MPETITIPETVTVPADVLLEAISYVDALGVIAARLAGGVDMPLSERSCDLVVTLAGSLFDPPDDDEGYETHPVNIAIWARSRAIVDEVLKEDAELAAVVEQRLTSLEVRLRRIDQGVALR